VIEENSAVVKYRRNKIKLVAAVSSAMYYFPKNE